MSGVGVFGLRAWRLKVWRAPDFFTFGGTWNDQRRTVRGRQKLRLSSRTMMYA